MKFVLCIAALLLYNGESYAQSEDSILNYIISHKSNSSLTLIKDDSIIVSLNGDKMMPLASTMKILVALEFSKQAAHHVFNPESMVALPEIANFYLPGTDGGAYPEWLKSLSQKNQIKNDSVSLLNVARGMMVFSSNANTEYLMDLLGPDNINKNYGLMGIKDFTPIYYYLSALMLYQNPKRIKEEKVLKQIRNLNDENYKKACDLIHEQLKLNPHYRQLFKPADLSIPMQKEWSNRLPRSTTNAFAHIAGIINRREIFSKETYGILTQILETVMQNRANQQWLFHAGMKGGNTLFVLTKTLYATLKTGERIELAYFLNDLDRNTEKRLAGQMNAFELKVLTDKTFIQTIKIALDNAASGSSIQN